MKRNCSLVSKYLLMWMMGAVPFFSIAQPPATAVDPVEYVNPLMGTDSKYLLSNGNTYPAIAMPWGMNCWMPQTGKMGDGWAYTYAADKIRGFKQTHQPSPWINDYGQFSIMPVTGKPEFDQDKRASWFSHKAEVAKPYYYKVYLADYNLTTEIAPTERAAMFRFTFAAEQQAYIVVDAFDKGSFVKILPGERRIVGYTTRNSGGVPDNFRNYFVIEFDKPFTYTAAVADREIKEGSLESTSGHSGAIIGFATSQGEQVHARVASSFISADQALLNLKELQPTFEANKAQGKKSWNDALGRIEVQDSNLDNLRTFYSCQYRTLLFPRKFYEIDERGQTVHYSPFNGKVLPGYLFTDMGFWDTFRALMPYVNLVYPDMTEKIQEGLLNAYLESGFYPEWASPGHRESMVGNATASVVADAFLKGITKADAVKMYEGLLHGANAVHPTVPSSGRLGYDYYNRLGYVPYNVKIRDNASRTLEYAYDDWCIYQMGKKLKRPPAELALYRQRSLNYRKTFNKSFNMMSGRNEDGSFPVNFKPVSWWDAFTEGNSWHYTWSVFHDVKGLIDLMGNERVFTNLLDSVFSQPPSFGSKEKAGDLVHEMREMQIVQMGQYAHGNQPIQHMIYLYNYAGQPWKAQYWVREAMNRLYKPTPDGYCGDEDNGQTSAWYVFSALGFYPVCPASDQYVLGSPLFRKVILHLGKGKQFTITAAANNDDNKYIQGIKLNGKEYKNNWIGYDAIRAGGRFEFSLGNTPNKTRGTTSAAYPYSLSSDTTAAPDK
ncbi:GH92 family glycosyl hydrolase [Paraflavitalea sp. CAU 1676]|uniref:GH92 family glycosyl hydrolase n=1 Tax=Paraflavitalea sp. CAU 1676 TaxID=3032598 RepID=UPI0023DB8B23|nr:GH92 family glycosyl hydrolase [Paraflavitalea sp. CAU 1676]MDF2191288.1 GH92 family glycosyl hydrolase [Paraflavitalea sp. CAU 1676]